MSEQSHTNNTPPHPQLSECKLCRKEVSPYSPFCRNCGHPQKKSLTVWILGLVLFLLLAFYLGMTLFCLCNVDKFQISSDRSQKLNGQIEQAQSPSKRELTGAS